MEMLLIWFAFGIFGTVVARTKGVHSPLYLAIIVALGAFGALYAYFGLIPQNELPGFCRGDFEVRRCAQCSGSVWYKCLTVCPHCRKPLATLKPDANNLEKPGALGT